MDKTITEALDRTERTLRILHDGDRIEKEIEMTMDIVKSAVRNDSQYKSRIDPIDIGSSYNSIDNGLSPIYLIDSMSDPMKSGIEAIETPLVQGSSLRDYVPRLPDSFDEGSKKRFYKTHLSKNTSTEEVSDIVNKIYDIKFEKERYVMDESIREYVPKIMLFYCNVVDPQKRHVLMIRSSTQRRMKPSTYRAYAYAAILAYLKRSCTDNYDPEFVNSSIMKSVLDEMIVTDQMLEDRESFRIFKTHDYSVPKKSCSIFSPSSSEPVLL